MKELTFDLFSGKPGKNAVWKEAVAGLSAARERMEQIAAEKPGEYFIYCVSTATVVAEIETFAKARDNKAKSA